MSRLREFNNQLQALGQEVEKAGFTTSMSPVTVAYDRQFHQGSFWKRTGADAARGRILSASDSMKRAVGVIIGREQRKVNRQILMQSLPGAPGPLEIIRDIPTAEEMLEMIRAELAEKDSDLVTELLD